MKVFLSIFVLILSFNFNWATKQKFDNLIRSGLQNKKNQKKIADLCKKVELDEVAEKNHFFVAVTFMGLFISGEFADLLITNCTEVLKSERSFLTLFGVPIQKYQNIPRVLKKVTRARHCVIVCSSRGSIPEISVHDFMNGLTSTISDVIDKFPVPENNDSHVKRTFYLLCQGIDSFVETMVLSMSQSLFLHIEKTNLRKIVGFWCRNVSKDYDNTIRKFSAKFILRTDRRRNGNELTINVNSDLVASCKKVVENEEFNTKYMVCFLSLEPLSLVFEKEMTLGELRALSTLFLVSEIRKIKSGIFNENGISFATFAIATGLPVKVVEVLDLRGCSINKNDIETIRTCVNLKTLLLPKVVVDGFIETLFDRSESLANLTRFLSGRRINKEEAYLLRNCPKMVFEDPHLLPVYSINELGEVLTNFPNLVMNASLQCEESPNSWVTEQKYRSAFESLHGLRKVVFENSLPSFAAEVLGLINHTEFDVCLRNMNLYPMGFLSILKISGAQHITCVNVTFKSDQYEKTETISKKSLKLIGCFLDDSSIVDFLEILRIEDKLEILRCSGLKCSVLKEILQSPVVDQIKELTIGKNKVEGALVLDFLNSDKITNLKIFGNTSGYPDKEKARTFGLRNSLVPSDFESTTDFLITPELLDLVTLKELTVDMTTENNEMIFETVRTLTGLERLTIYPLGLVLDLEKFSRSSMNNTTLALKIVVSNLGRILKVREYVMSTLKDVNGVKSLEIDILSREVDEEMKE